MDNFPYINRYGQIQVDGGNTRTQEQWLEMGNSLEGLEIEPEPSADVPESVTPQQARLALLNAGLLDAVNTYIDGLGEADPAYIAWHYAQRIQRNSPFVSALGPHFGLNETALDNLFRAAAALEL